MLVGCPCSGSPRGRCGQKKIEITYITGVVIDTYYSASVEGSTDSSYIGMRDIGSSSGTIDIPAKYGLIVKTERGKEILEGTSDLYKDAWKKLDEGDKVKITKKSIYLYYYDDKGNVEFKDPYGTYRDEGWVESYIDRIEKQ